MFFENVIFKKEDNLLDVEKALNFGNIFKDQYIGYRNYKETMLVPTSSKGELLLKIYQYDFALNDLSLYLDLHPEDNDIYNLFKDYSIKERLYVDEYEKKYGPMELDNSNYDNYMWLVGPWPWSKEGSDV